MFKRATLVIALSKSWESNILRHVPQAKTAVLPNAVDIPEFVPNIEDRKRSIFYAGKLEPRKGYTYLIEAFAMIAKDLPGWTLEFAGNGEVEAAKVLAERLGVSDRIVVHGWTERARMRSMLGNSKLFCLPSFAEGFPMSVLEAFASGCAVLTTPVGGLPDELVDGEDLLFFPPGDAGALADCIKRLATSQELMRALSLRGQELSRSRFSCEASIELLESLYRKAVS
jgi:glycosyltransferase involved in cell wall biosynthesis